MTTGVSQNGTYGVWSGISLIQGSYFAILGIWPILDIHTFQAVSGPKTDHMPTGHEGDHWLVITVGALIASIGITLPASYWSRSMPMQTVTLGILSALSLALVDVVYVWRNVIAPIYLADAAVEGVFIITWLYVIFGKSKDGTSTQ